MGIPSTQDASMPTMSDEQELHRAEAQSESNVSVAPTEGKIFGNFCFVIMIYNVFVFYFY